MCMCCVVLLYSSLPPFILLFSLVKLISDFSTMIEVLINYTLLYTISYNPSF